MNVVDSSGWLEYFADAPNKDPFYQVQLTLVSANCLREAGRTQ